MCRHLFIRIGTGHMAFFPRLTSRGGVVGAEASTHNEASSSQRIPNEMLPPPPPPPLPHSSNQDLVARELP